MGNVTKASSKCFEWTEDTSQVNEYFIIIYNKEKDKGYFLGVHFQHHEKLWLRNDLPFLAERMNLGKIEKLVTNLHD